MSKLTPYINFLPLNRLGGGGEAQLFTMIGLSVKICHNTLIGPLRKREIY